MHLSDFEPFQTITIQCHDNPDADTLGAGFALFTYFKSKQKDVRMVYSGYNKIQKKNLLLMKEKLGIPIQYIPPSQVEPIEGLLITVDCQYGAGNVTKLPAKQVAIIDHHLQERFDVKLCHIKPNVGSCSSVVWELLLEAEYPVNDDSNVGTALYYGLYTDTNQFSELFNPLDMDMRDEIDYNKRLISQFRNCNISLKELEIAGIAMIRYVYNDDYHFAVIKAQPCDPNILGLISDFLLQVAEIDTCMVYNEINDGYKISVRSCIKEVNANELAEFLTEGIGSGGGKEEKAGGFVSMKLYEEKYPILHSEAYFNNRMTEYFDTYKIIFAKEEKINIEDMKLYKRKMEQLCYIKATDIAEVGEVISFRTEEKTWELEVKEEMYCVVERSGEVLPMPDDLFERFFQPADEEAPKDYLQKKKRIMVKRAEDNRAYSLSKYVNVCYPTDNFCIYAQKLEHCVKVFPKWDDEKYLRGMRGDYLAVSSHDLHNIFIGPESTFLDRFQLVEA